MTKREEIEALKEFAERLGEDSYTGPWLKEQLPAIFTAILDDTRPDFAGAMTMNRARAESRRIIETGTREAKKLTDRAGEAIAIGQKKADEAIARARRLGDAIDNCQFTIKQTLNQASRI